MLDQKIWSNVTDVILFCFIYDYTFIFIKPQGLALNLQSRIFLHF
jgi:hypothetical protein